MKKILSRPFVVLAIIFAFFGVVSTAANTANKVNQQAQYSKSLSNKTSSEAAAKASSEAAAKASSEAAAKASSEAAAKSSSEAAAKSSFEAAAKSSFEAAAKSSFEAAAKSSFEAAANNQNNSPNSAQKVVNGWTVAADGYVFVSKNNIKYHEVKIPSNFRYITEANADASGVRAPANGGNGYARY